MGGGKRRAARRPSLDEFVEAALADDQGQSDWTSLSQQLAAGSGVEIGNFGHRAGPSTFAFDQGARGQGARGQRARGQGARGRLFTSSIGAKALENFGTPSRALRALSHVALQPLTDPRVVNRAIAAGTGKGPAPDARYLIVYHGDGGTERSILVLDPALPGGAPARVIHTGAFGASILFPTDSVVRRARLRQPGLVHSPLDIQGAAWITQPQIIVAPSPPMINTSAPRPPWKVDIPSSSTVGVIARDPQGRRGTTVCYHGTGEVGAAVRLNDGTRTLDTTVALASPALDIGFVAIPDAWNPATKVGLAGPLKGRAPGRAEHHTFQGYQQSAPIKTVVVGTDMGVPDSPKGRQLCVQTTADTNRGDSGAALVNQDDNVVGFAFQRTPFGADVPMEFADWVWALSALGELGLTSE